MRNLYIFTLLLGFLTNAQTALYNSGNIRIHTNGQLGFHTNLINNAAFDENVGLVGFYGSNQMNISGAIPPSFFDTEIANPNGVFLQTGINSLNNTNFVIGDYITPTEYIDSYYTFIESAFYVGDSDVSKVHGYAALSSQQNFTFPVGDTEQLRPLILNSQDVNLLAYCAYFYENPNGSPTLNTSYDTAIKSHEIDQISTAEFWRLGGDALSSISISWNERSTISNLTDDVNSIIVVGWSNVSNQWESLAGSVAVGDLSEGFVTSSNFIPSYYDIITFGSSRSEPLDYLNLDNYLVSVNNDGINDFFYIPELEQSPNNHLQIYNRFGSKVFDQENYTNQFRGISNVDNFVIQRENGLPTGVYFYIVSMQDLGLDFQGFLYLTR